MRCVIARYPFDLTKIEIEQSMTGVPPEPVAGVSVTIDRRVYPVMQVGEVITRQNRRDFTAAEMRRALTQLGFTCHDARPVAPSWDAPADGDALGW
ncbi:SCO5918 family protein [Streptomyces tropicalis]|uniref:SCO5918 family protein n=1 Tax=Streptomyces tropicalis TaxID=3034234 RepID=A0ABT6AAQ5_9ACTN|nr:SCO5918 family protein [Streptomyces tropicalis]MDF3301741.1 SCO5918 family protein [Streptomyces tropicalis]